MAAIVKYYHIMLIVQATVATIVKHYHNMFIVLTTGMSQLPYRHSGPRRRLTGSYITGQPSFFCFRTLHHKNWCVRQQLVPVVSKLVHFIELNFSTPELAYWLLRENSYFHQIECWLTTWNNFQICISSYVTKLFLYNSYFLSLTFWS